MRSLPVLTTALLASLATPALSQTVVDSPNDSLFQVSDYDTTLSTGKHEITSLSIDGNSVAVGADATSVARIQATDGNIELLVAVDATDGNQYVIDLERRIWGTAGDDTRSENHGIVSNERYAQAVNSLTGINPEGALQEYPGIDQVLGQVQITVSGDGVIHFELPIQHMIIDAAAFWACGNDTVHTPGFSLAWQGWGSIPPVDPSTPPAPPFPPSEFDFSPELAGVVIPTDSDNTESVPEPGSLLALGVLSVGGYFSRKRK